MTVTPGKALFPVGKVQTFSSFSAPGAGVPVQAVAPGEAKSAPGLVEQAGAKIKETIQSVPWSISSNRIQLVAEFSPDAGAATAPLTPTCIGESYMKLLFNSVPYSSSDLTKNIWRTEARQPPTPGTRYSYIPGWCAHHGKNLDAVSLAIMRPNDLRISCHKAYHIEYTHHLLYVQLFVDAFEEFKNRFSSLDMILIEESQMFFIEGQRTQSSRFPFDAFRYASIDGEYKLPKGTVKSIENKLGRRMEISYHMSWM